MRRKATRKTGSSSGRNALVFYLARLLGVLVTTAVIVVLGLAIGYTSAEKLVVWIVGGVAGLVAYWVVIKLYWRD